MQGSQRHQKSVDTTAGTFSGNRIEASLVWWKKPITSPEDELHLLRLRRWQQSGRHHRPKFVADRRAVRFKNAMWGPGSSWNASVDTTDLPTPDGYVDLTLNNLVVQCIPDRAVSKVVLELYRITRSGGFSTHRMTMGDEYSTGNSNRNDLAFFCDSQNVHGIDGFATASSISNGCDTRSSSTC